MKRMAFISKFIHRMQLRDRDPRRSRDPNFWVYHGQIRIQKKLTRKLIIQMSQTIRGQRLLIGLCINRLWKMVPIAVFNKSEQMDMLWELLSPEVREEAASQFEVFEAYPSEEVLLKYDSSLSKDSKKKIGELTGILWTEEERFVSIHHF